MAAVTSAPASAASAREAPAYRVTDLGTLPGAPDSTAAGVNDRGDVVGQSGAHAVLWRNGRLVDLGTLGGSYSAAVDVNEPATWSVTARWPRAAATTRSSGAADA